MEGAQIPLDSLIAPVSLSDMFQAALDFIHA